MPPISRSIFNLLFALSAASGTLRAAAGEVWIPAEPILPGLDPAYEREAYSQLASGTEAGRAATWGELCGEAIPDSAQEAPAGIRREDCARKARRLPVRLSLDLGLYPLERPADAVRPFESFGGTWVSSRVDPELGARWTQLPPVADVDLRYPVTTHSIVAIRIGLRRDLSAWNEDPAGSNLPLSDREVDLNEPSLGYFHAEDEHYAFTVGRFPVHWSPSPEYGLTLSRSVPYHNGAEFALKIPRLRYRFLYSSLNPWLEGTPAGDTSNQDYPPGSEEYRQRNYGSANGATIFHKRVYDARAKTLFAHRLEGEIGPLGLGITETSIIGGKPPDLRDAGPFIVFHNDFKEGYANGAIGVDGNLRLPGGIALLAEYYFDDVNYSETEGGDGNTASRQGWMLGVRHAFSARGWFFGQSLHAIRTDPYLYGYLQPLNTASSRIILASNNQRHGDSLFVDKYVIDYPVGYLRGGDAFDFWYRMEAWKGNRFHATFAAAMLAKGEVDLYTPYETSYSSSHDTPSGVAERELRLSLEGEWKMGHGLAIRTGAGWQRLWNAGHRSDAEDDRMQASAGLSWSIPD